MPYEDVARLLAQAKLKAEAQREAERHGRSVYDIGAEAAARRFNLPPEPTAAPGPDLDQALLDESQPAQTTPDPSWGDFAATMGMRIVPPTAGFMLGGPVGAGAGALLGETAAEAYEKARGLRQEISPKEIGIEGALGLGLGFVPGGSTAVRAGLSGAAQAVGGGVVRRLANEGQLPTPAEALLEGGAGAVLGAGGHVGLGKLQKMLARPQAPDVPVTPAAQPRPSPQPVLRPATLTDEQALAMSIAEHQPSGTRVMDPERIGPKHLGTRQGYVEGAPWGGWPGPPGTEDIIGEIVPERLALPPARAGRPPTPPSGEPIPLASPRPPGMEATGVSQPRFNVLRDAFELEPTEPGGPIRVRVQKPPAPAPAPEGQAPLGLEGLYEGQPVTIPPPLGEPAPVSPTKLRVSARFGNENRVADVEFGQPELADLFRAANRVSSKGTGQRKVGQNLGKLQSWLEQQFEVQFKAGGRSGLNQAASNYRKAVLQALRDAQPGQTVTAPDLETLLPDPVSNVRAMFRRAKAEGFTGTPDELAQAADLEGIKVEAHDPDSGSTSPRALLRAVANVGGIAARKGSEYPEVADWIRDSVAWRPPKGRSGTTGAGVRSRRSGARPGTYLPTGSVEGMPIYNEVSGFKTFDSLAESVVESYPQFEHLRDSRAMADALQEAVGVVSADTRYQAPFGEGWWRAYADETGRFVSPLRGGPEIGPTPDADVPFHVPGEELAAEGLSVRGGETGVRQPRFNLLKERPDVRAIPAAGAEPPRNAPVPAAGVDMAAGATGAPGPVQATGPEPRPRLDWRSEAGSASPRAAITLGGGGAGAILGGTQGDTPEERRRNAVIGAMLGAGAALGGAAAVSKVASRVQAPPQAPVLGPGNRPQRTPGAGQPLPPGRVAPAAQGQDLGLWSVKEEARGPIPPAGQIPKDRLVQGLSHLPAGTREDVADVIREHNYFQRQRRGVQSHSRTVELAKRITVELDRFLKPGTALNAETGQALGMALSSIRADKKALADKIAADVKRGIRNENDLFDLERLKARQAVLTASYVGAEAEAGRALDAYKILKTMQPFDVQLYRAARRKAGDVDALEALALKLAESDDPMFQFSEARKAAGARLSRSEALQSYFITNVLSGVPTQLRNTLGNAANLFVRNSLVPLLKAPIDVAWSKITGQPRTLFSGETGARLTGMAHSFDGALADAYFTLMNGFSKSSVEDMIAGVQGISLGRKEFRGGGRNPLNWVGRGMEATDRFFLALNKGAAERAHVYNKAVSALNASKRPVTAENLAEEMTRQKIRYADDKTAQQEVMRQALEGVYREPLGPMAQRLGMMKRDIPALNYVIPFVNTVSNIFRQGYEHTPISLAVKGTKATYRGDMSAFGKTREQQTEMLAKGAFGTLAMLPIAYLAAQGRISGNGPRDNARRQQLMDSGWRPNSILLPLPEDVAKALGASRSDTGQYWVNYALFQPLSIPMSLTANAFEAYHNVEQSEEKAVMDMGATRQIGQFLQGVAKSGLSQSYLQGLFSLVGAVQSDESMMDMWLQGMARSFVPMSGFVRGLSRLQDSTVRRPRGVSQAIMADLPFLQENVPARIGRYGEEIKRERPNWAAAFMVPEIEGQKLDPIDSELNRLGIFLPRPSGRVEIRDRMGNLRKLSQADEEMGAVGRGVSRRGALTALMNDPRYEGTPDVFKRLLIRRALNRATRYGSEAARYGIVRQDRNLLDRLLAPARRASSQSPR